MKLTAAAIGLILGVAGAAYTARLPPAGRESPEIPRISAELHPVEFIVSVVNPHDIENSTYVSALNFYAFAYQQQNNIRSSEAVRLWEKVQSDYLSLVEASVDVERRNGKFEDHDLSEWKLLGASNDVIASCQEFTDRITHDDRQSDAPKHIAHGPSRVAP